MPEQNQPDPTPEPKATRTGEPGSTLLERKEQAERLERLRGLTT